MNILIDAIKTTPIIDNHAHPLLIPASRGAHPMMAITSEAHGQALKATPSSLAHIRAVKQLAGILKCAATWDDVKDAIKIASKGRNDDWAKLCFAGIETVLIDDGLDNYHEVHPYQWHDKLTRSPCKRVFRIEREIEPLLDICYRSSSTVPNWEWFNSVVEVMIKEALEDEDIVAFKSVICYRTGLAIPSAVTDAQAKQGLSDSMDRRDTTGKCRLVSDTLGPWLVHKTAQLIHSDASAHKKPFQFHTGLGDSDIRLSASSPSHMQAFIEQYPTVPIVLLHASYPFTREAGYLATVYSNVYADIGEVFPFISAEGQERIVREILELCPTEKILWSTDGHWFPETYLLAIIQVREALQVVLTDYVEKGTLSVDQAVKIVQDLLFNTSNKLYNLNLPMKPFPQVATSLQLPQPPSADTEGTPFDELALFVKANQGIKFVRIQWMDYTATNRARILPVSEALKLSATGGGVGITKACFSLLQHDGMAKGGTGTGEYLMLPSYDSLRLGAREGYATIQGDFYERKGERALLCPRAALKRAVQLATDQGLKLLMGFEIEVVLMRPVTNTDPDRSNSSHLSYAHGGGGGEPLTEGHAWSTVRATHNPATMAVVEAIVAALARSGIHLQMFHAESAPGQFEFVLPPLAPLAAVDALVAARDVVVTVAAEHKLRATLYPKPFPDRPGTASHVHMSVEPATAWPGFYAGVLGHLRALTAFTYANAASYERAVDSCWAGGRWVAWGTQNRETPLRRIAGSHFELKTLDGLANPYLAVAAIVVAGVVGIDPVPVAAAAAAAAAEHHGYSGDIGGILGGRWGDCAADPATLSEAERAALGITERLPAGLPEALEALRRDDALVRRLGAELVENYCAVKEAEHAMLRNMTEAERRQFLIERY